MTLSLLLTPKLLHKYRAYKHLTYPLFISPTMPGGTNQCSPRPYICPATKRLMHYWRYARLKTVLPVLDCRNQWSFCQDTVLSLYAQSSPSPVDFYLFSYSSHSRFSSFSTFCLDSLSFTTHSNHPFDIILLSLCCWTSFGTLLFVVLSPPSTHIWLNLVH